MSNVALGLTNSTRAVRRGRPRGPGLAAAPTYQPGRRSPAWRKIKNIRTVDVLIGGWSPGGGRRTGTIGFLLVGVSTADGPAYIGNVGIGFTDADAPRGGSDPNSPVKSPTPRSALKGAFAIPAGEVSAEETG